MTQYRTIAVIGAGLSGVCSAYFLAQAGYRVSLIERQGNVAEQASQGNSGLLAAASLMPWAAPGLRRQMLGSLLRADSALLLSPSLNPALWRWLRKWVSETQLERYRLNKMRMSAVATYGQHLLQQIEHLHQLDYQATSGILQLFRSDAQLAAATRISGILDDNAIAYQLLNPTQVRELEPNLHTATALAGGWHFPQDGAGNCLFFIKQLKIIAQSMGVTCHFKQHVSHLQSVPHGVEIHNSDKSISTFDAVVVAAGTGSDKLLKPLGLRIPGYTATSYSAVATIKNPQSAPHGALLDHTYKTAIVRTAERIRITGLASLQGAHGVHDDIHPRAMRMLLKIANDWYPDAANYNQAKFTSGSVAMLPDGPPLIGPSGSANIFINLDGSHAGWAGAIGAAGALADLIVQRTPQIDVSALQLSRYAKAD